MKLVIAEKPMLARDIARAVCGVQVSEKTMLPISGNGYTVIACSGHLLELVEPDAVNPAWADRYDLDLLPISIPDWPKEPAVVRDRETGEVIDSKEPLIDKIAALLPQADLVIHAGDPDDEGQLIVDEVLDYLGYIGEVLRVYVNDNITKNIVRAFDHLVPNEGCRAAGAAANARSIADKCFGVNESRLASTRLHGGFYVGRVQTPTLGLVVARDEAIENHVTRKFYELTATGGCPDADSRPTFKFKPGKDMLAGEKHVFDAAPLETIKAKMDGSDATFTTVISEKTENPPLPYNLTVLLSDMSERFGFTAAKTQQITQDLRDKYKAITYNRSDSQYLKEEHFAQAPAVLAQAMENVGATWPLDYSIHSKAFNEKNVTAHHGIIPQEIEVPVGDMTEDEVKVYTAIVERYAAQFLPPAVYDVSTSSFEAEGGTFQAVSTRLREAGFKSVFPHMSKSGKADGDVSKNPWLPEGTHLIAAIACEITEGETTPPVPYTEGTLIADMASIAKYVTDPEVAEILKRKDDGKKGEHGGIGTTATRASIIEKLKDRGYIEDVKGKIRSTEKGRAFYRVLPPEISGADVTARWWLIQQDIAEGRADVNALQESVVEVFNAHKETAYVGASIAVGGTAVGKCPICGADVVQKKGRESGKPYYTCCTNRSEQQEDGTFKQLAGCGFKLAVWCGKRFTAKQAASLLAGKAVPLKGCISKRTGKPFDCKVKLKKDGTIEPIFDSKPKGKCKKNGR
ncbi:type IA DNA topoisomerase [Ruthenibacterium lactatiformans]|uniref:type IA DNA topoisomerase n=1 Tax=Ruthenibacterium lactatiformans TaxID=1550024 RepID=UPI001967660D|nr:type IA DNA topoisomerase [Ruthenibacterium lactatiformans]MBN3007918.1 DNA topoisomerase III [Ruthenibacterium lactatiformans]